MKGKPRWRKAMPKKIRRCAKTVLGRIWKDIKDFRAAVLFLAVYNVAVRKLFGAFCPQLIFTGFPCAGCGMTRAMFCIMTGQFARGFRLNPAALLWIVFLAWFFWNRYLCGRYRKSTKFWLGLVCAATLAIYIYRMRSCFPGSPPMVYYKNNILRRLFCRYVLHNSVPM